MAETDFEKSITNLASNVYGNHEEYEKKIKDLCVTHDVFPIEDFFNEYHQQILRINSEMTPSKDESLSVTDFKAVFQSFEKYPANIQKPKKLLPKDLTLNKTMASSKTDLHNGGIQNSTTCPSTNITRPEEGPAAATIYSEYRKFKQNLKQLIEELNQNDLELEHFQKLQKLNTLAKEVQNMFSTELHDASEAFNEDDIKKLRDLMSNMEKALFIDNNRYLFKEDESNCIHNLESIIELLAYWLNIVSN